MNTHTLTFTNHTHPRNPNPSLEDQTHVLQQQKKRKRKKKKCDLNKVDEQKCSFNLLVIVEKFSLSFSCDCCATKKNKQTKKYNNYKLREGEQKQKKNVTQCGDGRNSSRLVFTTYIYVCILYIFLCLKF